MMENKELINKIKVFRAMKNISQEELAIAIGVTRKTINTVETGKFVPSTILALRIARYFEVPVEEIFELNDMEG
ncbi:helix-turn-helix transcriptional regulator [Bacteroides faecalis]|uniref:Transcriptional regulator n=1 Tax=Bacteroides faecalis TaxID=2447885 RepID=A0A401LRA5_9BACE|nr:helix-turn-helix transcriptional regulator [Bacteroides faecalis]GCB34095.1 transcriptional regulator [Bacteroides faecalis]